MKIKQKRIHNIERVVAAFANTSSIYVAFSPESEEQKKLVLRAGFDDLSQINVKILPSIVGPVSRFNSLGKDKVHKELPKEPFTRWMWITDWNGGDHYVPISGMRYPREHISAPEEEISLIKSDEKLSVISEPIPNTPDAHRRMLHVINLFLSLFGECEILDDQKVPLLDESKLKRVNWRILPPGNRVSWDEVASYMSALSTKMPSRKKDREFRYQSLQKYNADEIYVGVGGFEGYLVFVFKELNLSIMESFKYGNATYVFDSDWQDVSQLTKSNILSNSYHKYRFWHNGDWESSVDKLFPERP